uniref:Uncharacterized protein n=1 Tax=Caenorhabditis japonica TaxID=281687 RepID=A0A8R1DRY7_CAEJA
MNPNDSGGEQNGPSMTTVNVKLGAFLNQGDDIPPGNSPATSISSLISEQSEIFRNSPFLAQSPLMNSSVFQRPDFLSTDTDRPMSYPSISTNIPDSECSSRSSIDGFNLRDSTSEKIKQFRERNKRSPSGSTSEEEEDSNESNPTRKLSSKSDEKFVGRGIDAPRGRIANIRRESSCSVDSEAAHERLVKASQVVSTGFDDIAIESEKSPNADFRRRAPSLSTIVGEPISVVTTNVFIPHSCSPSPTRLPADLIKQCYSPSTQQMVRPNISYSPSPKPSPAQSPTRHPKLKFGRSVSPICRSPRQPIKRKITLVNSGDPEVKRVFLPRSNTSPLVTDKTFPYPQYSSIFESTSDFNSFSVPHSPGPLRATTPLSCVSTGEQGDNSPRVKEKAMEEEDEVNDVVMSSNQETAELNERMLQNAAAAPLPEDDDDEFGFGS